MGEGSGLTRSTLPGVPDFKVIYFDFDESTLRADAQEALRFNAQIMRDNPDLRVQIHGHCDERGTEEYNLALGQRRAESAKRYLVDLGIRPARVNTKTFGEARPAVVGHNESAWAKNRRDEFAASR
jgi:peptidoglycan-associated lipoprotein